MIKQIKQKEFKDIIKNKIIKINNKKIIRKIETIINKINYNNYCSNYTIYNYFINILKNKFDNNCFKNINIINNKVVDYIENNEVIITNKKNKIIINTVNNNLLFNNYINFSKVKINKNIEIKNNKIFNTPSPKQYFKKIKKQKNKIKHLIELENNDKNINKLIIENNKLEKIKEIKQLKDKLKNSKIYLTENINKINKSSSYLKHEPLFIKYKKDYLSNVKKNSLNLLKNIKDHKEKYKVNNFFKSTRNNIIKNNLKSIKKINFYERNKIGNEYASIFLQNTSLKNNKSDFLLKHEEKKAKKIKILENINKNYKKNYITYNNIKLNKSTINNKTDNKYILDSSANILNKKYNSNKINISNIFKQNKKSKWKISTNESKKSLLNRLYSVNNTISQNITNPKLINYKLELLDNIVTKLI